MVKIKSLEAPWKAAYRVEVGVNKCGIQLTRAVLLKELLDRDAFFVGVEDGKDFHGSIGCRTLRKVDGFGFLQGASIGGMGQENRWMKNV